MFAMNITAQQLVVKRWGLKFLLFSKLLPFFFFSFFLHFHITMLGLLKAANRVFFFCTSDDSHVKKEVKSLVLVWEFCKTMTPKISYPHYIHWNTPWWFGGPPPHITAQDWLSVAEDAKWILSSVTWKMSKSNLELLKCHSEWSCVQRPVTFQSIMTSPVRISGPVEVTEMWHFTFVLFGSVSSNMFLKRILSFKV